MAQYITGVQYNDTMRLTSLYLTTYTNCEYMMDLRCAQVVFLPSPLAIALHIDLLTPKFSVSHRLNT